MIKYCLKYYRDELWLALAALVFWFYACYMAGVDKGMDEALARQAQMPVAFSVLPPKG